MTEEELNCVRTLNIDTSICSKECEGLNIVSYDVHELEPEWIIFHKRARTRSYKKTKLISTLSDQYNTFKGSFKFPSKYKSMQFLECLHLLIFCY